VGGRGTVNRGRKGNRKPWAEEGPTHVKMDVEGAEVCRGSISCAVGIARGAGPQRLRAVRRAPAVTGPSGYGRARAV